MTKRNFATAGCARTLSTASLVIVLFGSMSIATRQGAAEEIKTGANSRVETRQADRQNRSSEFNDLSNKVLQLIQTTEYAQALEPAMNALQIAEKEFRPNDERLANIKNSLGVINNNLGKYAEAERFLLSAKEIWQGNDNKLMTAYANNNLATLYSATSRMDDSEKLHRSALEIRKSVLGEHPLTAASLHNLAFTLVRKENFPEGEEKIRQAISMRKSLLGTNNPLTLSSVAILGYCLIQESRLQEARELFEYLIQTYRDSGLMRDDGYLAALNNLAFVRMKQGGYGEAKELIRELVTLQQQKYGMHSLLYSVALTNLGRIEYLSGNYEEAEKVLEQSFDIQSKGIGVLRAYGAINRNNLGLVYLATNKIDPALSKFREALQIAEKIFGHENQLFSLIYHNEALALARKGELLPAVQQLRKAISIIPATNTSQVMDIEVGFGMSGNTYDELYGDFISISKKLFDTDNAANDGILPEAFELSQAASSSKSSAALFLMSERFITDDSATSGLIRTRQDAIGQWHALNKRIVSGFSDVSKQQNLELERELTARLSSLHAQIDQIDGQIARSNPKFAELFTPHPLSIPETQNLLRDNEVLVATYAGAEEVFLWLVARNEVRWITVPLGLAAIADKIQGLRCGLDDEQWDGVQRSAQCARLLGLTEQPDRSQPLPFHFGFAHALYKALFGQVEDLIKDKHLLIVQSGPLGSLPFQVLLSEAPKVPIGVKYQDYRDVAWMARTHAITVLPSVASLRGLRTFAKASGASKDYIGFGNPVLEGSSGCQTGTVPTTCPSTKVAMAETARHQSRRRSGSRSGSLDKIFRSGAGSDPVLTEVRSLCPLPETAFEIQCVARGLGIAESELHLGEQATEAVLKELNASGALAEYRVLHFATHGLVAGDIETTAKRQGEPALVMTPPKIPKDADDNGLLTASEVTQLNLNADWVILSACNTAAGEKLGAEALSGLARAFFYAGARALLVSHWPVYSDAAVQLVNATFEQMRTDQIGRAEALRRAMVSFIEDTAENGNAHPAIWAPFVVVGEGGR